VVEVVGPRQLAHVALVELDAQPALRRRPPRVAQRLGAMSMPVSSNPSAASGTVRRPVPQGTSRMRWPRFGSSTCLRKASSASVCCGMRRCASTIRPAKNDCVQSSGDGMRTSGVVTSVGQDDKRQAS